MRAGLLGLALLSACDDSKAYVQIEFQSATLAQADDTAWSTGSIVLVGQPGAFTFPQPLALRLSLLEPYGDNQIRELSIRRASAEMYGTAPASVVTPPSCRPTACSAELRITGLGATVMKVLLTGDDDTEGDCFYVAQFEDPDPTGVIDARTADVEATLAKCLDAL